jgi:hypothetical protein
MCLQTLTRSNDLLRLSEIHGNHFPNAAPPLPFDTLAKALAGAVKIALGTDAKPSPHGRQAIEFEYNDAIWHVAACRGPGRDHQDCGS